jgi:hypothetical protein
VGLVNEDTLQGTERLLLRRFRLPLERSATGGPRAASFARRYSMTRNALAINRTFEYAKHSSFGLLPRVAAPCHLSQAEPHISTPLLGRSIRCARCRSSNT